MADEPKIEPRQMRFVTEYLIDLNGTQAAIRAGYSPKTANEQASALLAKPSIQAEVSRRMRDREARTAITQDRVLRELAKIAFADPRKVMTWGPDGVRLRDSSELTDDEAALVSEVSETKNDAGGSVKIRLHDKLRALEMIARHLGMFVERVRIEDTRRVATEYAMRYGIDPQEFWREVEEIKKSVPN